MAPPPLPPEIAALHPDRAVAQQIYRNRQADARCKIVRVRADASGDARVGLLLDDEAGTMGLHAPLSEAAWLVGQAALGAGAPPAVNGALCTHQAASSANERPERIDAIGIVKARRGAHAVV